MSDDMDFTEQHGRSSEQYGSNSEGRNRCTETSSSSSAYWSRRNDDSDVFGGADDSVETAGYRGAGDSGQTAAFADVGASGGCGRGFGDDRDGDGQYRGESAGYGDTGEYRRGFADDGLNDTDTGIDAASAAGPHDPGTLSHAIRRVLVKLIRGPYLSIDPDQAQEIAEDVALDPGDEDAADGGTRGGAGESGSSGYASVGGNRPSAAAGAIARRAAGNSAEGTVSGSSAAGSSAAGNTAAGHGAFGADENALFAAPALVPTQPKRRRRAQRETTRSARRATGATAAQEMWRTLVDNQQIIRSRLADMYLELVLDEARGLAFVRNMEGSEEGRTVPKLMNPTTLNHVQTMLLVRLRQLYLQASTQKQVAYVERHEMHEYLRDFINLRGVENDVRAYERANAAINKMQQLNVLAETSRPDRFRVQDIIVLLVTPRVADELIAQYQRIIAGELPDDADSHEPEDATSGVVNLDLSHPTNPQENLDA